MPYGVWIAKVVPPFPRGTVCSEAIHWRYFCSQSRPLSSRSDQARVAAHTSVAAPAAMRGPA
jgi:hypothetical protein